MYREMVSQGQFYGDEVGILGAMEKHGLDLLTVPSSMGIANDLAAKRWDSPYLKCRWGSILRARRLNWTRIGRTWSGLRLGFRMASTLSLFEAIKRLLTCVFAVTHRLRSPRLSRIRS